MAGGSVVQGKKQQDCIIVVTDKSIQLYATASARILRHESPGADQGQPTLLSLLGQTEADIEEKANYTKLHMYGRRLGDGLQALGLLQEDTCLNLDFWPMMTVARNCESRCGRVNHEQKQASKDHG